MALTLQVRDSHRLLPADDVSRELGAGALTIGRGPQNDWVLPDPERVISSQHCAIEASGDRFVLTDTSSNGVYLNGAGTALGRGKSAELNDGDTIRIGHFEIEVHVAGQAAAAPAAPEPASDPFDDFGLGEPAPDPLEEPAEPAPGQLDDIFADSAPAADDPFAEPSGDRAVFDQVPPEADLLEVPRPMAPAEPAGEIPTDWDDDDLAPEAPAPEPVAPIPDPVAETAPEPAPAPTPAPVQAAPKPAPAEAVPARLGASDKAALEAFLKGAGLDDLELPEDEALETFELLGSVYREVVTGLMDVLAARGSIKNEFRLSQTMIRPVENNPLKFSLGAEDAMAALLTKKGRGYLPPLRAIGESFDDVKAHQVAMLAGMQMALKGLFARFDPKDLERRIEGEKGIGTLLTGKKARYWDEFTRLYENLVAEAEDDFESVFGREFGRAYDEQVRKLKQGS